MMEKDKLRKADIFSGAVITLFGLWVISQGLKMPMKDSWGGVQNVWFVSPALFPLLVGAMIAVLGLLLTRTALKEVGFGQLALVFSWLCSIDLLRFLKTPPIIRFYAIAILFFSFVYLNIPRVDFFLCSLLFLAAFITMFYLDEDVLLKKMLFFYLSGTGFCAIAILTGLSNSLDPVMNYPNDCLTIVFILSYCIYTWTLVYKDRALRRKFRTSLILSTATPFIIGPIFKYLLLVPMPTEGLIVALMDAVWYWEF
jgi:hypothetical protein